MGAQMQSLALRYRRRLEERELKSGGQAFPPLIPEKALQEQPHHTMRQAQELALLGCTWGWAGAFPCRHHHLSGDI